MQAGILTLDLHGKNTHQARVAVDVLLRRAGSGTYRIRLIHGHHSGTILREFLRPEYAAHPKVKRLIHSSDGGTTELVLREFI